MSLATGARLGHYSIVSPIGAGGMGAVYRAHDPRLGRDVAIKVLPAAFSDDPERLRRFEQEARAAGTLSHPNILVIHDVEVSEPAARGRGTDVPVCFVVMELLEGGTLRDELDGSPLPVRTAVDYALQITRGLTAAHDKGIVHRDLKPENLFATSDGRIKILDFGIAKLRGEGSEVGRLGQAAAVTQQATDPGLVIGTVGYMSPEQVRGAPVDHRSDLFSFGVVLYEMLSGRRAFSGASAVETLNAILKDSPPDISEHAGGTRIAPALNRIIARCLEKKPERRFQSASDLGFALEALTEGSGPQPTVASPAATDSSAARSHHGLRRWWIAAAVAALALAAGLAWIALPRRSAPVDLLTMRLTMTGPEDARTLLAPMVSPDGRYVAFGVLMPDSQAPTLWLRAFDSVTPRRLPGTDGASGSVIWSPDNRSFVFPGRDGTLKRLDLAGGPPRIVSKLGIAGIANAVSIGSAGGSWSRDGTILFNVAGTPFRVSAAGGEPTRIDTQGTDCRSPSILPDGRHFLCLALTSQPETSGIHVASLDGGPPRRLLAAESHAVYVQSRTDQGSLLFMRESTLLAQPFDARTLELTGEPTPVVDRVHLFLDGYRTSGRGDFSVSDTGVLVYSAAENDLQQLTALDRAGKPAAMIGDPDLYFSSRLSPDDRRLAVARIDAKTRAGDIHVIDLASGTSVRLTFNPADDYNPVWSPDGRYIVWGADRGGKHQLLRKLATGVGQEEVLREASAAMAPDDWSPDGRLILYREFSPQTNNDLWLLPLDGDKTPFPFLQTTADEPRARFSPDGYFIGYISNESGAVDSYVQTFPASGSKWQVSSGGGGTVSWRRDGKELYYLGNGKLWAVEVKHASPFELGGRHALFDQPSIPIRSYFAASGDGQRFVFAVNTAQRRQAPVYTVVLNWAAESGAVR